MNIILASASKRRQKLLSWLIKDFEIKPSQINETAFAKLARNPEELVVKLSLAKAKAGGEKVPNSIIIAADTIVAIADTSQVLPSATVINETWQIIGKPKDKAEIAQTLSFLSGKTHQVYTGLCVLQSTSSHFGTDFELSHMTFKNLSKKFIDKWSAQEFLLDHAGSYSIQDMKDELFDTIEGSYTSVVGLPLAKTADFLEQFGVVLQSAWQDKVLQETGYKD
ncbi:septum formation protein Maf [Candidatus Beckwithbacteria bacterium]|nr:septum formation protein Maf [Candidatus Beckwithbacteria bacterium]